MGDKRDTADWRVAEIAGGQYGVVTAQQLTAAGLTRDGTLRRVRAGRLHRIHRGVYAVGHRELSVEGRWMAAVLACGSGGGRLPVGAVEGQTEDGNPANIELGRLEAVLAHWGAALSHRSAAELWGLLAADGGRICVSVAGIGGKGRRRGVHVHRSRTLAPEMATTHRGIPVTTPARTIADLRRAPSTRGCPAAIAPWELRRAIRQAEVLGLRTEAEAIAERTRSDLELAFLRLCERHRLPEPEVNVWIGSLQVDFLWRDARLVVESDGYRYHRGRSAFEEDRDRDLRLRALGYEVVRISERQVSEEPQRISETLREILATKTEPLSPKESSGEGHPAPPPLGAPRSGLSG